MSQINIGIFGLGRFGNALVGTLNSLKCENTIHIRVLDKDPKKVEAVKDLCDDALILDLDLDDEGQLQQHFEGLNVAVIAIGENTLPVIELASVAQEIRATNPDFRILCRAHDEKTEKILAKLGIESADVFSPEKTAAEFIGRKAVRPGAVQFPPLSPEQGLICMDTPEIWQGKPLGELNIPKDYNSNLICLVKFGDTEDRVLTPTAESILEKGDKLYLLGELKDLAKLQKLQ